MFKFTGFTEKANKSLNKAVEAAQDLGHTDIGSEHLLLGLLSDTSTVAGAVLAGMWQASGGFGCFLGAERYPGGARVVSGCRRARERGVSASGR